MTPDEVAKGLAEEEIFMARIQARRKAGEEIAEAELEERRNRLEELAAEHERHKAEPTPVEKAGAALEEFTARFVERESKCRSAVFGLESDCEELRRQHSTLMYAGEPTDEIVKKYQKAEAKLAEAKSALSLVSEWRIREAAKIRELEDAIVAAYQRELEDDFNALQAHRVKIAQARQAYITLVVEDFRMEHDAARKVTDGFHLRGFPIPAFRNPEPAQLEITMADIQRAAGKPWKILPIWPQIRRFGQDRTNQRTMAAQATGGGDDE